MAMGTDGFSTQKASNVESFATSWFYYVKMYFSHTNVPL